MMLFPLGGGNEHELSAHFYTHEVHNPAVVKGVMQDAFDYMKKYHDVKMTYSLPRIHVEPDFQTQIAHHVGGKKKKLHPTWNSFIHLVQRKKEKKERLQSGAPKTNPGSRMLNLLISKQERMCGHCACVRACVRACVCVCVCVCVFVRARVFEQIE